MFSVTGTSRSRRSTRSPITASPPRRFGLRGHSCCAGCYRRRRLTSSTLAAARACPCFPQSRATGRGDSTFGAPVTPGTPPYPADRVDVAAGTVTHRRRLSRWQGSHRAYSRITLHQHVRLLCCRLRKRRERQLTPAAPHVVGVLRSRIPTALRPAQLSGFQRTGIARPVRACQRCERWRAREA